MEINKDLNYLTGIVLKKISSRKDGFYHELYPYFELEDGTHIEDIGVSPKRIAENLVNYHLAHSLVSEKCELTELGIKIGQGIGFEMYLDELNKIEKEKSIQESSRQDLKDKIDKMKLEELEYKQTIRGLEEELKISSLIKNYWWLILSAIGIGISIGKFLF